jgi:hypothetical protein
MGNKNLTAVESLREAQKIAFAPFVFQTAVSLRKLGILDLLFRKRRKGGLTVKEIATELDITPYGVDVLLELAESSDIVSKDENDKYLVTKVGYFLNSDEMTTVNLNFTNDVCYKGLFYLDESIKQSKPVGLKELGDWDTIYQGLSVLPGKAKESWFKFDHLYSSNAFDDALKIVFKNKPKTIFDIGGNTGKFALSCCEFNSDVEVKILDLPIQLNVAMANVKEKGYTDRISGHEIDLLSKNPIIPKGADAIWMSQFLDCFSKDEILKILKTCVASMDDNTEIFIMELFTDRQDIESAKFSLQATSLYFTAFANGNSKMYRSEEMINLIGQAGLVITNDIEMYGGYHTILTCKKK